MTYKIVSLSLVLGMGLGASAAWAQDFKNNPYHGITVRNAPEYEESATNPFVTRQKIYDVYTTNLQKAYVPSLMLTYLFRKNGGLISVTGYIKDEDNSLVPIALPTEDLKYKSAGTEVEVIEITNFNYPYKVNGKWKTDRKATVNMGFETSKLPPKAFGPTDKQTALKISVTYN